MTHRRRFTIPSVVGIEAIDSQPGPKYGVFVVPGLDQERPGDPSSRPGAGTRATQDDEVPSGTEIGAGWTVLVWCRAFGVPVAHPSGAGN